jgi:hypothetical protein
VDSGALEVFEERKERRDDVDDEYGRGEAVVGEGALFDVREEREAIGQVHRNDVGDTADSFGEVRRG